MSAITMSDVAAPAALARKASYGARVAWLVAGAIALRLLVFLGRGDYIAFDEGWYLLLGRSLFSGDGYTLSGLRHTTLSPLFPVLSGAVGVVLRDPVWAGRLVAALAGGLLVLPCWHIFNRLAGRRTAFIASTFVATMPSLAAFAAPYWVRWDLWVGAEPLLHLFLFSGIALVLRARATRQRVDAVLAGIAFGLAYLARPEAVIVFALLGGAAALALLRGRPGMVAHGLALALGFALTATPYWLYLHDSLGRWALTGRVVEVRAAALPTAVAEPGGAASTIERMLWLNDERPYVRVLYGLDPSGTRLSSGYWGIPVDPPVSPAAVLPEPAVEQPSATGGSLAHSSTTALEPGPDARVPAEQPRRPGRWQLYASALGIAVPWYIWMFAPLGLVMFRSLRSTQLLFALPLVITSVAIARIVAADPRTQLFVVPLVALYAAVGLRAATVVLDRRLRRRGVRRRLVLNGAVIILLTLLVGTSLRWTYLGISMGSPHHLVGTANHRMGEALQQIVPEGAAVMSWHPAIALYADRDWRVLPQAGFREIVRYANAIGCEYIVFSAYYPAPADLGELPGEHLLLHVPPGSADRPGGWHIQLSEAAGPYHYGRLQPAEPGIVSVADLQPSTGPHGR